jgi:hypothetical protein
MFMVRKKNRKNFPLTLGRFSEIIKNIMKRKILPIVFLLISSTIFSIGEQIRRIGSDTGWAMVEKRDNIIEVEAQRPYPVLSIVARGDRMSGGFADMFFTFDESSPARFSDSVGNYKIVEVEGAVSGRTLSQAGRLGAQQGIGAALFSRSDKSAVPLKIIPASKEAMFSSGKRWGNFSIEFWARPFAMDNGEQAVSWDASKQKNGTVYTTQRITCTAVKNKFQWTFFDFFTSSNGDAGTPITISGITPVIPRIWSHHLIRFDAHTGLLEYLVNGKPEAVAYATSTGREGGDVYFPLIGEGGILSLGGQFSGILDEFKVYPDFVDASIAKYPSAGGRIETRTIDLGEPDSRIIKVEAATGRFSFANNRLRNEYGGKTENAAIRFVDDSALQFFIRTSDSPYRWENEWTPFTPGAALGENMRGRYAQIAVQFYPSGDGEASPYLDEIRIVYKPNEPPLPPSLLTALAKDGAVELSWKESPDSDVQGYFVYYGTSSNFYFGEGAVLGTSPIDVGNRASVRIEGLKNGALYYFAVAAYDRLNPPHLGAFSREVTARPLRMAE